MNISTLQSKERRLLKDIRSLHRKIEHLSKSSNKSSFNNLLKLNTELAKKQVELGNIEQKLSKERQKENAKLQKDQDNQLKKLKASQMEAKKVISSGIRLNSFDSKEYDVFISYVQSDSFDYVNKLETALTDRGIVTWRDKSDMQIGKSMTESIENALVKSKLAIVVLSPNYLQKYWTNFELNGIFSKQNLTGEQMILPIWNNVSAEDIGKKRPFLANLLAWNVSMDKVEDIASYIAEMLGKK